MRFWYYKNVNVRNNEQTTLLNEKTFELNVKPNRKADRANDYTYEGALNCVNMIKT